MTPAEVYRKLPAMYSSWHSLRLEPRLKEANLWPRNLQESKTLVNIADELLVGNLLTALMIVIGRLKAITEVATPESGGWSAAPHMELVRTEDLGMLTARDRELANMDQRDSLRLRPTPAAASETRGRPPGRRSQGGERRDS